MRFVYLFMFLNLFANFFKKNVTNTKTKGLVYQSINQTKLIEHDPGC